MSIAKLIIALAIVASAHANEDEDAARIVNGEQAYSGQFPWMAGVQSMNDNGQWNTWLCGGALISKNLVVTAAHCVDAKPRPYRVSLGSTLPGDWSDGDGKTMRNVDLIITRGDALVLRLSESVSFTNKIYPVRLPGPADYLGGGVEVTVSGWGGTGENNSAGLSNKLLFTRFNTVTNQKCAEWYGTVNWDKLCYVNQHSTTCGGDSGSPVVRYINNQAVYVGIHDAGVCRIGYPSIATRISINVDWLNSEIRRHSQ